MDARELKVGEVVQINPESDPRFAACLMVVSEPKSWGAQGYVVGPGSDRSGQYYYRCKFEDMEPLNVTAEWQAP